MTNIQDLLSKKADIVSIARYFGFDNLQLMKLVEEERVALLVKPRTMLDSENVAMFEVYLHAQYGLSVSVCDVTEAEDAEFEDSAEMAVSLDDADGLKKLWGVEDLSSIKVETESFVSGALYNTLLAQAKDFLLTAELPLLNAAADIAMTDALGVGVLGAGGGHGAFTPPTVKRKPKVKLNPDRSEVNITIPVPKRMRGHSLFSSPEALETIGRQCGDLLMQRLDSVKSDKLGSDVDVDAAAAAGSSRPSR